MFDDFIKRNINSLLQKFVENTNQNININKWEGIIEKYDLNLKTQHLKGYLSEAVGMPLEILGAKIHKLSVQIPWTTILKEQTKIIIDGIYIYCQTIQQFNLQFYKHKRNEYIEEYIQKYSKINQTNDIQSKKKGYLSKVKQFVLGKISFEIKSVHLCIQNHFEQKFKIGFTCENISFTNNEDIVKTFSLTLSNIGMYISHQVPDKDAFSVFLKELQQKKKIQYCIKPTTIRFQRIYNQNAMEKIKNLVIEELYIVLNNEITNDIKFLVRIIQWHSNINKYIYKRPNFTQNPLVNPKKWWAYVSETIFKYLKDQKYKNKYYYLKYRREYIQNYKIFYKGKYVINKLGPNNSYLKLEAYNQLAEKLKQMEEQLEVYQIIEYRKYAILYVQSHKQIQTLMLSIKKKESNWFMAFFGGKDQKPMQQLERAAQLSQTKILKLSEFNLIINNLKIQVSVKIFKNNDPFVNFNIKSIQWKNLQTLNSEKDIIEVQQIFAQYDEFLSYHQNYKYLLRRRDVPAVSLIEDQFQDFEEKFLKIEISRMGETKERKSKIKIQPFVVIFNDEIIDKIQLFILTKYRFNIIETAQKTQNVLFQEILIKLGLQDLKQSKFEMSLEIIVPQSLYQLSNDVMVRFEDFSLNVIRQSQQHEKTELLQQQIKSNYNYIMTLKKLDLCMRYVSDEKYVKKYLIEDFFIKLVLYLGLENVSFSINANIHISPILFSANDEEIDQLIYFVNRYKKFFSNNKKLKKQSMKKRKPSLGQEYMDAVQNIADHLYKSTILKSKQKKAIALPKQAKQIVYNMFATLKISMTIQKISVILYQKINNTNSNNNHSYFIFSINEFNWNAIKNRSQIPAVYIDFPKINLIIKDLISCINFIKKIQIIQDRQRENYVLDNNNNNNNNNNNSNIENLNKNKIGTPMRIQLKNNLTQFQLISEQKLHVDISLSKIPATEINIVACPEFLNKNYHCHSYEHIIEPFKTEIMITNTYNKLETVVEIPSLKFNINKEFIKNTLKIVKHYYEFKSMHKLLNKLVSPIKISNGSNGYDELQSNEELELKNINVEKDIYIIFGEKKYIFNLQEQIQNHIIVKEELEIIKKTVFRSQHTQNIIISNFSIINNLNTLIQLQFSRKKEGCFQDISKVTLRPEEEIYLLDLDIDRIYFVIKIHNQQEEIFDRIAIKRVREESQEILIQSFSHFLILIFEIIPTTKGLQKYQLHISCPVEITNFLPSPLSLKFNKESIDYGNIIQPLKSMKRRKSFQILTLEEIKPAQSYSFNNITMDDINQIYIVFEDHSLNFKFNLEYDIEEKSRNENLQTTDCMDIEITKILALQSEKSTFNILCKMFIKKKSIKIFFVSEYIIFNMLDFKLYMRIKERDYFYNEIKLQRKKEDTQQFDPEEFRIQSYNSKQLLKEIFHVYHDNLMLFSGNPSSQDRSIYINQNEEPLDFEVGLTSQPIINIRTNGELVGAFMKKIELNYGFGLIFINPVCTIINKTQNVVIIRSKKLEKVIKPKKKCGFTTVKNQFLYLTVKDDEDNLNNSVINNVQFCIDINILGINYYRKIYTRYIAGQIRRSYKFYRIFLSRSQYSLHILIQQSQYPPITFINKTNHKLKIYQQNVDLGEEIGVNKQLQYALQDRKKHGIFAIYIQNNNQFRLVVHQMKLDTSGQFMDQKTKSKIYIRVETFKEKQIIVIYPQNTVLQQIKHKFEENIENLKVLKLKIQQLGLSLYSNHQRECFYVESSNIFVGIQLKNQTTSIKLECDQTKGFNYTNLLPIRCFAFQKNNNLIESLTNNIKSKFKFRKQNEYKPQFSLLIKYNFNEDVKIIKQAYISCQPINTIIDINFMIDIFKNFSDLWITLEKIIEVIKSHRKIKRKKVPKIEKTYIIQSIRLQETTFRIFLDNLNTLLELYKDSTFYSVLITILNDIGQLKPLKFDAFHLQYQKISLRNILRIMNFDDKIKELISQLMLKPAIQFHNFFGFFFGFASHSESSLIRNSIKASFYFIRTLLKTLFKEKRIVQFKPNEFEKSDLLSKLQQQKFWLGNKEQHKKYYECSILQIPKEIERYQRYSFKKILSYDKAKALVKFVLDLYYCNKLQKEIRNTFLINNQVIIGLTIQKIILINQEKRIAKIFNIHDIIKIKCNQGNLEIYKSCISDKKCLKSLTYEFIKIDKYSIEEADKLIKQVERLDQDDKFFFNFH